MIGEREIDGFGRRQSWLMERELPQASGLPGGTEATEWQAPTR